MRWGRQKISPFVCVSTPTNILITLHRRSRKPCLPTSKSGSTPLYAGSYGRHRISKSPVGCLFYDFSAGILLRLMSLFRLPSLVRCSTTPGHTGSGRVHRADFGAEQSYIVTNGTSTSNKIVGMYAAPSGSTLLIDRNCHKSLAHLLMMNDVVPVWLKPTRNALGILVDPAP